MKDDLKRRVPSEFDLMHPTLQALEKLGGSGRVQEIDSAIAESLSIDDEVLSFRKADNQPTLFKWNSAWARTHLKYADAIQNPSRGIWTINEHGRSLQAKDMNDTWKKARDAAARKRQAEKKRTGESDILDSGEQVLDNDEQTEWKEELLGILRSMSSDAFERLSQRVLRESNFSKVEVTRKSGDGGIDGTGVLEIGLVSFSVLFQCKCYTGSVGPSAIRDFGGAMAKNADKGIFITSGDFTAAARKEAVRIGIDLIDGEKLCDILKEKGNLGVTTTTRQVEDVKIDSDFFESI